MNEPKKLFIKTFGCQMNEYDSAKMADVLSASHGYERTLDPEAADLMLLNTCSIREKAQERVFSELGRWKDWKTAKPGRMIGVGGCVASQEGEALAKRAKIVDVVFGPQTLHRLPELLEQRQATSQPAVDIRFPEIEKFDRLPAPRAEGPTAFVSIMEGCSKYCSFCIVPYTRGEEVSRPLDDVLAEVHSLISQGVREITLLGQNVNAYRGAMTGGPEKLTCDLALLLLILARMDGVGRLRFTTSHPAEFSDGLIEAYRAEPKVAGYLHLPVQSGSDRILSLMKRGYTRAQFIDKVRRLRIARPGLSLSSDFIVGFPGETDDDFEATMDLIETVRFDTAFSFIYSARPGTPAATLRDDLSPEIKHARLERLQARIKVFDDEYAQNLLGSEQQVLVERVTEEDAGIVIGRVDSNRWLRFPVSADQAPSLVGRIARVLVTSARRSSLGGRLIDLEACAATANVPATA